MAHVQYARYVLAHTAHTGMHTFQTEPTEYVCNVLVIDLSVLAGSETLLPGMLV